MTKDEALKLLQDAEVVPCISGSIADVKEILDACLAMGVPAILDRGESCGSHGGCVPRIDLCVRQDDLPKVMAMMHERWQALLDQEGTLPEDLSDDLPEDSPGHGTAAGEAEDTPPCPACGTAAPLVDGACKECGLQLA